MKHKSSCKQPKNNLYWCPWCKECYCQHKSDEVLHTWMCIDKKVHPWKEHANIIR